MGVYDFIYKSNPARVVFGIGTVGCINAEAELLGINRALVLTTGFQEQSGLELVDRLGDQAAGLYANATMHTPVSVTDDALRKFDEVGADGFISCGGGSTIGLGKALALRNDAPQLVIPTSYAGSEMTAIVGQTEDGKKQP